MPNTSNPSGANAKPGGRGRRASPEITERLLEAAIVEIRDNGLEAARVGDIARRCKLSMGSIYGRWQDKQEFFLAAIDHVVSKRWAQVGATPRQYGAVLAAFGADQLRSSSDDGREILLEACVTARRDATYRESVAQAIEAESSVLSSLVTEAKAEGVIDESLHTDLVVLCCQAFGMGLSLALSASEDRLSPDVAAEWDNLMRRMFEGLAPQEPDAGAEDHRA